MYSITNGRSQFQQELELTVHQEKILKDPESFSSFEIAIFNPRGDFATSEVLQIDDDVVGWQGREDINNIIEMIISQ